MFQRAYGALDDNQIGDTVVTKTNAVVGSKFTIKVHDQGVPRMSWELKKYNMYKPSHPMDVLKFCCNEVTPKIKSTHLNGFTEPHQRDEFTRPKFIF